MRKQNDVGHKFAGDVLLELDGLTKFKEYMDHKEFWEVLSVNIQLNWTNIYLF